MIEIQVYNSLGRRSVLRENNGDNIFEYHGR